LGANAILHGMGLPPLRVEAFYSTRCTLSFSAVRGSFAGVPRASMQAEAG
jgi:hypothetical protein